MRRIGTGRPAGPSTIDTPDGRVEALLDDPPPLLEVLQEPKTWLVRSPLYAAAASAGIAALLALFCTMDVVATAEGVVRPLWPELDLKCAEAGEVASLRFEVGDDVARGDLLFEVRSPALEAALRLRAREEEALELEVERLRGNLEAEAARQASERELHARSVRLLEVGLERARKDRESRIRELDSGSASAQETLRLAEAWGERMQGWVAAGHVARQAVEMDLHLQALPALRHAAAVAADRLKDAREDDTELRSAELEIRREEARAEAAAAECALRRKGWQDRADLAQARRDQKRLEREAVEEALVRCRGVSPFDGIVTARPAPGVGALVAAGEPVYRIARKGSPVHAEASIPSEDRAGVWVGQPARLKISAFPYREHGVVPAEVVYVSPDAAPGRDGRPAYTARLRIGETPLGLKPGMAFQAELVKRRQRVAGVLLDGLLGTVDRATGRDR